MSITRRLFLRQTAVAGAAVTVSAPAVAEPQPTMTPAEQAKWHLNEAHRLMEQITGRHYDAKVEDGLYFALLIQREKPSERYPSGASEVMTND